MSERAGDLQGRLGVGQNDSGYWQHVVPLLGLLLLVSAGIKSLHTLATSGILLEAALDFLLIGSLGVVTLYVGTWLPRTNIEPAYYPRIALWVTGGLGVMAVVIGLRVLHPGVTVEFTFGTHAVLLAMGSFAGLAIGVHEAQALVHANTLQERNDELEETKRRLDDAVEQLESSKDQLESSNAELEDANDQLEASNDELEASNEQLEQFAYAASHDLREPLRMVTSYLQLIDQRYADEFDEDGEEFIEFALDGARRMDEMIEGLLAYSRVDTEGETFGTVDLEDILDDVLADLEVSIEESDATITRSPLPTVACDGRQLRQVFQNLVSNAIQYSGDEPPRIHVAAVQEGDTWTLVVRDEGPGIDPEDAERIFEVFQRLHSTEEQSGSGIGLAICDRIVDRHDGEIWVESEPGEGSAFKISLPSDAATRADASTAESVDRSDAADAAPSQRETEVPSLSEH